MTCLLFLLTHFTPAPMSCIPRVISFSEATAIAQTLDQERAYSLSTNGAEVIPCGEGFLVLPVYGMMRSGIAFLIQDPACLKELIENDYFPVYDPNASQLELSQAFNQVITEGTVANYLGIPEVLMDATSQEQNLLRKRYTLSSEAGKHLLQLYILDQFRQHFNGQWGFFKRYGEWNPYYEPFVLIEYRVIAFETAPALLFNYWSGEMSFNNLISRVNLDDFPLLRSMSQDETIHAIQIVD